MKQRSGALLALPMAALAIVLLALAALPVTGAAQQYNQWSSWMGTNSSSIEYRYEVTGQYLLSIQFRNDGNTAATISYSVWVPGQDQAQTGTTYANANNTSAGVNISTTNGQPPSRVDVQIK